MKRLKQASKSSVFLTLRYTLWTVLYRIKKSVKIGK